LVATLLLTATIVFGLVGQWIRDRTVPTAIMLYLPLLPAGLAAIVLDLWRRGRALGKVRFGLTTLGAAASICSASTMIGAGAPSGTSTDSARVTVLHWNVQWGGGIFRSPRSWAGQRSTILGHHPDIIILSELPPADWVEQLVDEMGPGASIAGIEHDPGSRYWFRLAVCSRWPVRLEDRWRIPGGVAMSASVEVQGRPIRILAVDGRSNPFVSRLPFLHAIAAACQAAADQGRPFDCIAGDFNTPSRSVGFDAFEAQGFSLASRFSGGWRGTFPSWLPIYDIDHVWIGPRFQVGQCALFHGPAADHSGQVVQIRRLID
jgi:endonuclease/exonuclease/phosphatase family metal-dependent hydrolase